MRNLTIRYLELRFNSVVKVICGCVYTISMMVYMAIVVYTPALALETVVGLDVDLSCGCIFLVCLFYTSVGGMKAVVWTDVFQLFFMFLSVMTMIFLATSQAGGASAVLDKNYQDGRIQAELFILFVRLPTPDMIFRSLNQQQT